MLAANPTLTVGTSLKITAGGFAPGEALTVTLFSTPRPLTATNADEAGAVLYRFAIPFDLEPGAHSLELAGSARSHRFGFTVVAADRGSAARGAAAGGSTASLPSTGNGWLPKAFFAVLLLWLGLILLRHATHLRRVNAGQRRRLSTRGTTS